MKVFVAITTLAAFATIASANIEEIIGLDGLGVHGLYHSQGIQHGHGIHQDFHAHPAYKYSYGVADKLTGDVKSASEVRNGAITKGHYSLVQPDGVVRTVKYIVDPKGGFQAQVINKGVAGHPAGHGIGHHGRIGGIGAGLGYAG